MFVTALPVYIIVPFLSNWLLLQELRSLDDSLCNHTGREIFLNLLSSSILTVTDHGNPFSVNCLYWLSLREISLNSLNVSMSSVDLADYFQFYASDKNLSKLFSVTFQLAVVNKTCDAKSRGLIGMSVFQSLSTKSSNLQILVLCDCFMHSELVMPKPINLPHLTELVLKNTKTSYVVFMVLFGNSSNVSKLDLFDFELVLSFKENEVKQVTDIVRHFPNLKEVGFPCHVAVQLEEALSKCPLLNVLKINNTERLSPDSLNFLEKKDATLQLTGLHLKEHAYGLHTEKISVDNVFQYLEKRGGELQLLNLSNWKFTDVNVTLFPSYIPNIRMLNLGGTGVAFSIVVDLCHVCENLEYLNVTQCVFDSVENPRGVVSKTKLHSLVVNANKSLKPTYYLHNNQYIQTNNTDDRSAEALGVLFSMIPCLLRVDLQESRQTVNNELLTLLFELQPNLIELILARCTAVGEDCITTITRCCKNLRVLNIVGCAKTSKDKVEKKMKAMPHCVYDGPLVTKDKRGNNRVYVSKGFITLNESF